MRVGPNRSAWSAATLWLRARRPIWHDATSPRRLRSRACGAVRYAAPACVWSCAGHCVRMLAKIQVAFAAPNAARATSAKHRTVSSFPLQVRAAEGRRREARPAVRARRVAQVVPATRAPQAARATRAPPVTRATRAPPVTRAARALQGMRATQAAQATAARARATRAAAVAGPRRASASLQS